MPSPSWKKAFWVIASVYFVLIIFTFRHYGVTWDEEQNSLNGLYFLKWYSSFFSDHSIIEEDNQRFYGSFFNGISRAIAELSPLGLYDTNHLLVALMGLLGLIYTFKIGDLLLNARAGFFSSLFLILTPVYYGHSFNNPKDIPFAVLCLMGTYYSLVCFKELPNPSIKSVLKLSAAIGFACAIRIGGVFLLIELVFLVLLSRADLRKSLIFCATVFLLSWLMMLPWWPYAQISPILHPFQTLVDLSKFPDFVPPVFFNGISYLAKELPLSYIPTVFALTLPDFYPFALAAGALTFKKWFPAFINNLTFRRMLLFVIFSMLLPVVAAIARRSIVYDGIRHFIFVIPLFAIVCGCLFNLILENSSKYIGRAFSILLCVLLALTAGRMFQLHPYQYIYYNEISGGLKTQANLNEVDYWGVSLKEGFDWLVANYQVGAKQKSILVANTAMPFQTSYYIERYGEPATRFEITFPSESPNVVLTTTRWQMHKKIKGKVLHIIDRNEVPLLYVIETKTLD